MGNYYKKRIPYDNPFEHYFGIENTSNIERLEYLFEGELPNHIDSYSHLIHVVMNKMLDYRCAFDKFKECMKKFDIDLSYFVFIFFEGDNILLSSKKYNGPLGRSIEFKVLIYEDHIRFKEATYVPSRDDDHIKFSEAYRDIKAKNYFIKFSDNVPSINYYNDKIEEWTK